MAEVNDIVDSPDGSKYRLVDPGGDAPLKWQRLDSPMTFTGAAKAAGSGLLHEGVANTLGLPGDIAALSDKAAFWGGNKLREALGKEPLAAPPKGPLAALADTAVPDSASDQVLAKGLNALSKAKLPTSEKVKGKISEVVPEYEPQNFAERAIKTSAGFVPAAMTAPEAVGANLLARGGRSLARYAAAPGVASEGVREIPGVKGSSLEEPLALGAALAAPGALTKMITPNPASRAAIADRAILADRGVEQTPGQVSRNPKLLDKEPVALNAPLSGTTAAATNNRQLEQFTQGALRELGEQGTVATPQALQRIRGREDALFDRLTTQHSTVGGTGTPLERLMRREVDTYTQNATRVSPEPAAWLTDITNKFDNNAGWITGRQYQNMRSDLSAASAAATNPAEGRVLSRMRDLLDAQMEATVRHFNPADAGLPARAREFHTNRMILERALSGQSEEAAHHLVTPQRLGSSAERMLGRDTYQLEDHPLGQLARAGQRGLPKLKEPAMDQSTLHNIQLGLTLAGGAAGGAGGTAIYDKATGHDSSAMGYLVGALLGTLPAATRVGRGLTMRSATGNRYLGNQALPLEAQPGALQNPANAALMAELLARGGDKRTGTKQ